MDEPGYHARRRAEKESRQPYAGYPETQPMPDENGELHKVVAPEHAGSTGFAEPNYRPAEGTLPDGSLPGAISGSDKLQELAGNDSYKRAGPHKDDPDAQHLGMQPHLQIMCGPMLRYDNVTPDKVWHGFALLVCADGGSDYAHSKPVLRWHRGNTAASNGHSNGHNGLSEQMANTTLGADSGEVQGIPIYVFHALHGSNTFWRFKLEIQLQTSETPITYSINHARSNTFWVPGREQNMRWMGHSCNGFSAGVKTEDFNGSSPLWNDFMEKHAAAPFHALVGGGDQIYCDPIAREPELSEWLGSNDVKFKISHPLTEGMSFALNRFFMNHYCSWFRNGTFAKAIASVPMINMLDDHDLIDGFGTYPADLQSSPVFSAIGSRGYFWYLLFQMFIVDDVDGSIAGRSTTNKSMIIGGEGAWIPTPSHNFLCYLGPKQYILLLDCRAERKIDRIVSSETYERVFAEISKLPDEVEHLTILLGVPALYPRMIFAEKIMSSTFSPIKLAAKLGMSGMQNKFNQDAELLDDLNDHWTAASHKEERNWLVQECVKYALQNRLRITFLSGDVHAGAVGYTYAHTKSKTPIAPEQDPKYMLNVISSAIVNTPPPAPMISLLNKLASKTHSTLHHAGIDESMIPLFETDTDGKKLNNKYIIGRRNYVIVNYNETTGELEWDMRVEKSQGEGTTKGYLVKAPAVQYKYGVVS